MRAGLKPVAGREKKSRMLVSDCGQEPHAIAGESAKMIEMIRGVRCALSLRQATIGGDVMCGMLDGATM